MTIFWNNLCVVFLQRCVWCTVYMRLCDLFCAPGFFFQAITVGVVHPNVRWHWSVCHVWASIIGFHGFLQMIYCTWPSDSCHLCFIDQCQAPRHAIWLLQLDIQASVQECQQVSDKDLAFLVVVVVFSLKQFPPASS